MAVQEAYKKKLIEIVGCYLPQCKIWLFGSRAKDLERSGSDIDLALDNGTKIPWEILMHMRTDIDESIIPMSVDLVDLQAVAQDFKQKALSEGVVWKS